MRCGNSNAPRPVPPALKCVCQGLATWFCVRYQWRKARLGARKAASRGSSKMTRRLFGGPRGPNTAWKLWCHRAVGHTA